MQWIYKITAACFIICVPIILFVWLFFKDITPNGIFSVHHEVTDSSPFIDRWLPDTRVLNGEIMIDEPAYASVHTPGEFATLEVNLAFENKGQPIVELGILKSEDPLQYDLQPLQNLLIDNSSWDRTDENGIVLLQRHKIYKDVDAFLAEPPDRSTIATYNYSLEEPLRLPEYIPSNVLQTVQVSLRGYHEFVTYIKNEPLLVQADFMDMNRDWGEDSVEILVFNEKNELVASEHAADDGITEATSRGSSL